MKVSIFYPKYCIFTSQVCATFLLGGLIGTSEKCIYGVIGICASVSMHVLGMSSKTHFGLQRGVKVHEKFSNLFSRYLEGRSRLCTKDKYEHCV